MYDESYFTGRTNRHRMTSVVGPLVYATRMGGWAFAPNETYTDSHPSFSEEKVFYDVKSRYKDNPWPFHMAYREVVRYRHIPADFNHQCSHYSNFHPSGSAFLGSLFFPNDIDPVVGSIRVMPELSTSQKQRLNDRIEDKLPNLKPEVDMVVFLSELPELLTTLSFLKETGAKFFASGFLTWSFGVKPFVQDVISTHKLLSGFREKLAALRKGVGKVHDFSTSFTEEEPVNYTTIKSRGWSSSCPVQCLVLKRLIRSERKISATVKYRYTLPFTTMGLEESILTALKGLGLHPTIDTLWEKIPFSFVVDWVFNTERILKNFRSSILDWEPATEIIDFCISDTITDLDQFIVEFDGSPAPTFEVRRRRFARYVRDDACNMLSWWLKLPSFMQLALGAALTITRRRK
jgi:hypothetical protein